MTDVLLDVNDLYDHNGIGSIWLCDDGYYEAEHSLSGMAWGLIDLFEDAKQLLDEHHEEYKQSVIDDYIHNKEIILEYQKTE
tara:strand:- start:870 stop:1115 length:246 start_codon:yes stop_codon:yes gene_type:complete